MSRLLGAPGADSESGCPYSVTVLEACACRLAAAFGRAAWASDLGSVESDRTGRCGALTQWERRSSGSVAGLGLARPGRRPEDQQEAGAEPEAA